jgi:ribosomal protein S12 methylthiotransferase accessory factor
LSFFDDRATPELEHPRLRSDLRIDVVSSSEVLLIDGSERFLFESAPLVSVIPLLNGTNTVPDIAAELSSELSLPSVLRTVSSLTKGGFLVEGPVSDDPRETSWFDHLGVGPEIGIPRTAATKVSVNAIGDVEVESLERDLRELGMNVVDLGDADLAVVVCDDYLNPAIESFNRWSLEGDRPWVLVSPTRAELWLGPLMVPGLTGCWRCLEQRLSGNRQMERYIQRVKGVEWANPSVPAATPVTARAAAAMTATEIGRVAAGGVRQSGLLGRIVTTDLLTWASDDHVLVRQPQCPDCGDPEAHRSDRPVVLSSQQKIEGVDSGHRVIDPAETVARLEHHVSPLIGAVSSLYRYEVADSEVSHNYAAGHNFAMMTNSMYLLRKNMRGLSGGKGRTDTQAKASALCEAIERYSGVWRGDEAVRRASADDLGDEALDFNEILGFSPAQYANRATWNTSQSSGIHLIPEPLASDRVIDWTQVWSLTKQEPRWIPTAYCYFGHPDVAHKSFCFSDANGNAAGNTLEEAILQGFLELVERDSVAIWWYNRLRVPEVSLASIEDPYIDQLLKFYNSMNRDLRLLDLTSDLGIPAFAAVSRRLDHPVEDPLIGFGAHIEPRLGALRALTECNQFLPGVFERDESGNTSYFFDDPETVEWFKNATSASDPYLVPAPDRPISDVRTMNDLSSGDIAVEITECVDVMANAGLEVFVLDQSRPDLDIKVAKVVVPGLRHFWRRLGAGRLYEAPLAMGHFDQMLVEEQLNPKSVFF